MERKKEGVKDEDVGRKQAKDSRLVVLRRGEEKMGR
jgi:hypothetical protein